MSDYLPAASLLVLLLVVVFVLDVSWMFWEGRRDFFWVVVVVVVVVLMFRWWLVVLFPLFSAQCSASIRLPPSLPTYLPSSHTYHTCRITKVMFLPGAHPYLLMYLCLDTCSSPPGSTGPCMYVCTYLHVRTQPQPLSRVPSMTT